jgi:hypothetical protein
VKFLTTVAATAFLFWAAPALAQDPAEGFDPNADPTAGETFDASGDAEWSLEGEVGLVTDYRFRGISRTAEQPAAQASATLEHRSGFYAGLWGSTLAGRAGRGDFEVDATLGYRTALGAGTEIDGGLQYQFFPDGDGADYGEAFLSVAHTLGPVTARRRHSRLAADIVGPARLFRRRPGARGRRLPGLARRRRGGAGPVPDRALLCRHRSAERPQCGFHFDPVDAFRLLRRRSCRAAPADLARRAARAGVAQW